MDFGLPLVSNRGPEKLLNRNNIYLRSLGKKMAMQAGQRTGKKRVRLEMGRSVWRLFHSSG